MGELGAGHLFQPAVPVHCGGRGRFQHDRTGHAGAVVSTASRDFINYNNADYDALFAQAQACYDDGEQTALYRAMEKNLAENAANVYIQDMADFVAVRDGLEGPSFYPIYVLDLSTIHYTK